HFAFRSYPRVNGKADTKKPASRTMHLYVVPNGARTFLAFGENEKQSLTKVKGILAGTDKGLGGREDLQALRTSTSFGGFLTIGLFDAFGLPDDGEKARAAARATLEHAAAAPAPLSMAIPFLAPPAEGERAFQVRIRAPRAVVQELVDRVRTP